MASHEDSTSFTPASGLADRRDNKILKAALNRIQADLHLPFGSILANGQQYITGSHGPIATLIREAQAMTDVSQPKPLGHEHFDALAAELPWGVSE